ncbi:MAG: carbohydrate binding family 9 domain-containing protein [Acidimicrobiia bacterium]|nr:carbohydrate binding family 9 domain-containing protein [Acidimicrobiia bacterium]
MGFGGRDSAWDSGFGFAGFASAGVCAALLVVASTAGAQSIAVPPDTPAFSAALAGAPPPPAPPSVISRDPATGRATIRAVRIDAPIDIDGRLSESIYEQVPSFSDFVQLEPNEGAPATQKTEAWLLFDDEHVYVMARCWESRPDRMVANEMRHDNMSIFQSNDNVTFIFDTYRDRRNGVLFAVNPIGGHAEGQATNERQYNGDLNIIWEVSASVFEGGWSMEAAIPFKSLRYRPGAGQVWGFNIKRETRWNNETAFVAHMPNDLAQRALMTVSLAPALVGIEVPDQLRNLDIKPYAIASLSSDRATTPPIDNDPDGDVGIDVKYGLTPTLTADFTWNTDFAQVEADEQQVNLTRFSLFFPEKREFFLENKGTFDFGTSGFGMGANAGDTPVLFYSRRIGLQGGTAVPILGGGRLSGRTGPFSVGVLNIQTDGADAAGARSTNFTVARVRRDILRRSTVGALVTRRSIDERGGGVGTSYGVDGAFAFFDNLVINAYWAATDTAGAAGTATSYRGQLDYGGDRYGVQLERLRIDPAFSPAVGFVRRTDMDKSFGQLRFSPRPQSSRFVRRYSGVASLTWIEDTEGRLESRDAEAEFSVEFHNSDKLAVSWNAQHELLPEPFRIAPGVTLPVGGYDFGYGRAAMTFGPQRRVSGTVSVEHGSFYTGYRSTVSINTGRVELTPRLSLQPLVSMNRVTLPEGDFTSNLVGSRATFTMTPLMFVSALVQYASSANAVSANVRLRWEYRPGSELFVVYNEQRDTAAALAAPSLVNRAVIVKVNRLLRF